MIKKEAIERIVAPRVKRKVNPYWNRHTFYLFCAWVAFAGALTGLMFAGAAIFDAYRATKEVHEVWTLNAQGQFIPMKEKGKRQ